MIYLCLTNHFVASFFVYRWGLSSKNGVPQPDQFFDKPVSEVMLSHGWFQQNGVAGCTGKPWWLIHASTNTTTITALDLPDLPRGLGRFTAEQRGGFTSSAGDSPATRAKRPRIRRWSPGVPPGPARRIRRPEGDQGPCEAGTLEVEAIHEMKPWGDGWGHDSSR